MGAGEGELCQGGFCPSMRVGALPHAPGFHLRLSPWLTPASAWHLLKGRPAPGNGAVRVSRWGRPGILESKERRHFAFIRVECNCEDAPADSFRVLVPSVLGLVLGVENREGGTGCRLCP